MWPLSVCERGSITTLGIHISPPSDFVQALTQFSQFPWPGTLTRTDPEAVTLPGKEGGDRPHLLSLGLLRIDGGAISVGGYWGTKMASSVEYNRSLICPC